MHKILRIGPYTVAIDFWKNNFKKKDLEVNVNRGYKIIRSETVTSNIREFRYSWIETEVEKDKERERAFIRGYFQTDEIFHIQRIKNTLMDRYGILFFPQVLDIMEDDLKKEGVKSMRANVFKRLVPSCKRFGFESYDSQRKKHWIEYVHPRAVVPLERKLKE